MMKKNIFLGCLLIIVIGIGAQEYQSQLGQDRYINEHFFHNKKNGVFLDIGAHDGKSFSNTYFFEKELGWTGICFEPLPHLFQSLQACRDCICINAGVAEVEDTLPFLHVVGCDEMLSGLCGTYDQRALNAVMSDIKNFGGECRLIQVPCVRIDKILTGYGMSHIDFLSLDTEGNELEILNTINFSQIKIDVITVENNYNEPAIREFLEAKGFIFVTRLQVDDIFVHKDFIY